MFVMVRFDFLYAYSLRHGQMSRAVAITDKRLNVLPCAFTGVTGCRHVDTEKFQIHFRVAYLIDQTKPRQADKYSTTACLRV